jgi:acyl-CoA thioester hydrolase
VDELLLTAATATAPPAVPGPGVLAPRVRTADRPRLGETRLRVRFHELDPNGHVNHGVYANYFETARIELLERLGFGPRDLAARDVHLVVVELRLAFRRPALGGDELTVRTRVAELRRASSRWRQELRRGDELLATAEVRSAATDATGRPVTPPSDLLTALRAVDSPVAS